MATDLWGKAPEQHEATLAALDPEMRTLYAGHLANVPRVIKTMQRLAVAPDKVVDRIERALTASKPRARYYVNPGSRAQLASHAVTPTAVFDAIIARFTGVPRRPNSSLPIPLIPVLVSGDQNQGPNLVTRYQNSIGRVAVPGAVPRDDS